MVAVKERKGQVELALPERAEAAIAAAAARATAKAERKAAKESGAATGVSAKTVEAGAVMTGRVTRILAGAALIVELAPHTYGRVHITDLSDEWTESPLAAYKLGQTVKAYVLSSTMDNSQQPPKQIVDLSLRASRTSDAKPNAVFPEIKSLSDLVKGQVVKGTLLFLALRSLRQCQSLVFPCVVVLCGYRLHQVFDQQRRVCAAQPPVDRTRATERAD